MGDIQALLLVVSFVLSLIAAWSVVVPFFALERGAESMKAPRSSALSERRDRLFRELEELEFDFRSGRISKDEYESMRAQLSASIAEALKKLDAAASDEANGSR